MVEVEASLSLAFGRIFFAEACIRTGNRRAFPEDVDIGGVGSSEVVIIQSILELQLPVRIEGVGKFTRHDLNLSGRALIDDEIKKRSRLAEKIIEIGNVSRKARKYETAVTVEPRHAYQVVIGIVECWGILTGRAFRNGNVAAAAVVRPCMIAADMQFPVSAPERAHQRASMAAGVEKAVDLVVLIPRQQHRMPADMGGDEVMRIRYLGFKADENPGRLEDVLHLRFVDFRIDKRATVDLEDMFGGPIIDQPGNGLQVAVVAHA